MLSTFHISRTPTICPLLSAPTGSETVEKLQSDTWPTIITPAEEQDCEPLTLIWRKGPECFLLIRCVGTADLEKTDSVKNSLYQNLTQIQLTGMQNKPKNDMYQGNNGNWTPGWGEAVLQSYLPQSRVFGLHRIQSVTNLKPTLILPAVSYSERLIRIEQQRREPCYLSSQPWK